MSTFPALLESEDGSLETIQVEAVETIGEARPVTVWKDADGALYVRKSMTDAHVLVPAPDDLDVEFPENDGPESYEPKGVQEDGEVPAGYGESRKSANEADTTAAHEAEKPDEPEDADDLKVRPFTDENPAA